MLVVEVISKTHLRVIHYTAGDPNKVAGIPDSMQAAGVSSLGVAFKSGSGSFVQGVAMVIEEVVELDPTTETIEIITYSAKTCVYSADKAIERARKKLGEKAYHLFSNNCESVVNWALTGEAESKQGEFAKIALTGAGGAAVGIAVGVLCLIPAFSHYFATVMSKDVGKGLCKFTFTIISSLTCLHTFGMPSLHIFTFYFKSCFCTFFLMLISVTVRPEL